MAPEHAFDRLYRRYARDVYRFAYGLARNRADAEDVSQTAFLNAYRALVRGHTPESPRSWLLAIAQNVYRQGLRRSQRRVQEVALDVELAEAIAVEEQSTIEPSDVRRALTHLSTNQRAALVLRELEGRSYAEIAAALGVSMSAVETLIFRARRALREQLEVSLTCAEAERLIGAGTRSRQLRAHLRECAACSTAARSARARRSALRSLFGLPWFGGSTVGGGSAAVATKVATVVVATGIAGGLTQLLATPPAKPQPASRVGRAPVSMPVAAEFALRQAPKRRRRPVVEHPPRGARTNAVAAAPVRPTAHPDPSTVVAPADEPAARPAATTSTQPAAPAAPSATAATTATTATTSATATVAVVTAALPAVPPATITVTVPSLPPVPVPDLTQTSQN